MQTKQLTRLKIAAADPANWRTVSASKPTNRSRRNADAAAQIDAAMIALIDLAPDRLGWQVLALCERLISPKTETEEHLQLMSDVLGLVPLMLYTEAFQNLQKLMLAAGRHVVSLNSPTCAVTGVYFNA